MTGPFTKAGSPTSKRRWSEWPQPVRDVLRIDAELVRVVFTSYLLVEQSFSDGGSRDAEAGHPVDCVDRKTEPIRLVLNG